VAYPLHDLKNKILNIYGQYQGQITTKIQDIRLSGSGVMGFYLHSAFPQKFSVSPGGETRWAVHKRLNRSRCRLGADSSVP